MNQIPDAVKWYGEAAQYYRDIPLVNVTQPNQQLLYTRTHSKLIQYDESNYLGYANMARYYEGQGQHQEAKKLARQALQHNPSPEAKEGLQEILK
jgi:tetratricopeptide (TPR) repeat protein